MEYIIHMERELIQRYAKEVMGIKNVNSLGDFDYRFISNSFGFASWVMGQIFTEVFKLLKQDIKNLFKKYAR